MSEDENVGNDADDKGIDDENDQTHDNNDNPGETEEAGELLEQDEQGERLFLRAPRVVRRWQFFLQINLDNTHALQDGRIWRQSSPFSQSAMTM